MAAWLWRTGLERTLPSQHGPTEGVHEALPVTAAVVAMVLLARAKHRVAAGIGSGTTHADSRQTDFCAYLSAILLAGLVLNVVLSWWWSDPLAGLVRVPLIAKEGVDGLKGTACCGDCGCH